jgi:hypothetical protein
MGSAGAGSTETRRAARGLLALAAAGLALPAWAQCPGAGCPAINPAADPVGLLAALEEQLVYVREIGAVMSAGPESLEGRILLAVHFEPQTAAVAPQGLPAVAAICREVRSAEIRQLELIGLAAGADVAPAPRRCATSCSFAAWRTGSGPAPARAPAAPRSRSGASRPATPCRSPATAVTAP